MPASHILIVDDEPSLRALCRKILESAGHIVSEAESAQKAAQMLKETTFAAIITDLRMPAGSGETLIQWILTNHPEMRTKILILTADPKAKDRDVFLRLTGIPLVEKPYTVAQLLEAVGKILPSASA